MDLNTFLEYYKLSILLGIFIITSYKDIKFREVDDKYWAILFILTAPVTFFQIGILKTISFDIFLLSLIFCTLFGFLLFYGAKFGGADAKAVLILPFVFPDFPKINYSPILFAPIIFPLSIIINAILYSIFYIFINVYKNIRWFIINKNLFDKNIKLKEKIILFFIAEKVTKEKIIKNKYYISLFVKEKNNKVLKLFRDVREINFDNLEERKGYLEEETYWIENAQPFLVYLTISIVLTLLLGDVFFLLIKTLIGR